jgi:hypothetical protein
LRPASSVFILQYMSDERKPKDDFKEGLGLIFRAAKGVVKQVDISKVDKELDKVITGVGRVAVNVGRVVGDELNRVAANPPWQKGDGDKKDEASETKPEGEGKDHPSDAEPEKKSD